MKMLHVWRRLIHRRSRGAQAARLQDVRQRKHAGADIKIAERARQAQAARPHAQRAPPARERAVCGAHACTPAPSISIYAQHLLWTLLALSEPMEGHKHRPPGSTGLEPIYLGDLLSPLLCLKSSI